MRVASRVALLLLGCFAAGWAGARLGAGRPDHAPAAAGRSAELAAEIGELRRALADERRARGELSRALEALERAVGDPGPAAPAAAAPATSDRATETASADPPPEPDPEREREILLAAGFAADRVEEYRRRLDEVEMERLFLRDQAVREGWGGSARLGEEMAELEAEQRRIEEELGEDLVDWARYARGEPNRVGVGSVMAGSPAARAGLEVGDVVLRYGDSRVRQPGELLRATRGGVAGASTEIEVLRDGRSFTLVVPRGPLGVRMRALSIEPERRP